MRTRRHLDPEKELRNMSATVEALKFALREDHPLTPMGVALVLEEINDLEEDIAEIDAYVTKFWETKAEKAEKAKVRREAADK